MIAAAGGTGSVGGPGGAGEAAGNDFLQAGQATCGRRCLWEAGVHAFRKTDAPGSRSPERPT